MLRPSSGASALTMTFCSLSWAVRSSVVTNDGTCVSNCVTFSALSLPLGV